MGIDARLPNTRASRAAALALLAALAASGCTTHTPQAEDQVMLFAGVRPVMVADRSHLEEDLEMRRDLGLEFAGSIPFYSGEVLYAFNHMPMDGKRSGDDFDFYWLDAVASQRVRFTEADHGSPLYLRWGVGWSLLYLDAEEEHDMGGAGLVGRLGLGSCFGSHAGVEVFGDVHGWVGLDADDARAAWGASLGISLFIAF